jgi:catalase
VARAVSDRLAAVGAVPRFVGSRLGAVNATKGDLLEVDVSIEAAPAVLFDGMVLPDGLAADGATAADGRVLEFIKDQYRHCKTILAVGSGSALLEKAAVPQLLPSGERDPGLVLGRAGDDGGAVSAFVDALSRHRHFERETDPPRV